MEHTAVQGKPLDGRQQKLPPHTVNTVTLLDTHNSPDFMEKSKYYKCSHVLRNSSLHALFKELSLKTWL